MWLHWISCSLFCWCRECICISFSKWARDATKNTDAYHMEWNDCDNILGMQTKHVKRIDFLHSIKVHFYVPNIHSENVFTRRFLSCSVRMSVQWQRNKKEEKNCRRILIFPPRHCKLFPLVCPVSTHTYRNAMVSNHNRRRKQQHIRTT